VRLDLISGTFKNKNFIRRIKQFKILFLLIIKREKACSKNPFGNLKSINTAQKKGAGLGDIIIIK